MSLPSEHRNKINDLLPGESTIDLLNVLYNGVALEVGQELTPVQVSGQPTVEYSANTGDYYTLMMVDPDTPGMQCIHWATVNIPGNNVSEGTVMAQYVGSAPPKGVPKHRYTFILAKQPSLLTFKGEYKLGL
eukprot:gene9802-11451_t